MYLIWILALYVVRQWNQPAKDWNMTVVSTMWTWMLHLNCTNMKRDEYKIYQCMTYPWSWIICNENMFPFNYILDETEFMSALPANDLDYVSPNSMSKLLFVPFEFNEDPSYIPGFKYNPDIHFFNQISLNINFNSNYYLEDVFKNCVSEMSTSTL